MKAYSLLTIALLLFASATVRAQYDMDDDFGKNDLFLGEGIISGAEIRGWEGPPVVNSFVSMPSSITGAAFLTYRHFLTRKFALGFTAGIDEEQGDLSFGNPEWNSTGLEGTTGHYSVHAYTFAVEALLSYVKKGRFMFYGYTGLGATFYDDKCTLYTNGAPVTLPSDPYDYKVTNFNFQVTPVGIRFGGNIAGFVELGVGYKGIFSGGGFLQDFE